MKILWNKQCENNIIIACCLFACLFLYHHTREFFTHTVTSPLPVKWCKFWPMLEWWPLSSEGSNACHTFSDTGHPFIIVISDEPWHTHLCCVQQWSCHYLFYVLDLSRLGFEQPTFRLRDERSNPLHFRN